MSSPVFASYVALGDSTTEGLNDLDGNGGYRGWADRLAERLSTQPGGVHYANLAVRGRRAGEVRAEQLPVALEMKPALATVVAGMNDLLRSDFDAERVAGELGVMQRAFAEIGTTVVSFTLPDVSRRMPIGPAVAARTRAFNQVLRRQSAASGALLLDLAELAAADDPRLWDSDRLHANPDGHARMSDAVAWLLGLSDSTDEWREPLPPPPRSSRRRRLIHNLSWARTYVVPWAWRRIRGVTLGDGRAAKRPELTKM